MLVAGRVDAEGRLVAADQALADLHLMAGGRPGGTLAVPQIATLARLARRLGITVARPAIAAEGERDLDLWVRAEPDGDDVRLEISGWTVRQSSTVAEISSDGDRETDFERAAADWTFETDDTLALTQLSAGAAEALGQTSGALIGRRLVNLFRFRESAEGGLPILTGLAEQASFNRQLVETPGGRFLLSGVPLIDGMGRFAGFRGSAEKAPAAGDVELPSEPIASVPQDNAFEDRLDAALRGPLNHIVAAAELLRTQTEGPLRREYSGYATDIASAGRHLLAMVDDLVDLQAIERSDYRPIRERIDLADISRRAAGLLSVRAADRQVRIDKPVDGEHLFATGEFRRVLQIMMNLLTNAIRYSPEGGQVWIRPEREGDRACLTIADMGHGIAVEDQGRIFDKFERVDPGEPGGTGLGLYIARRLARAMSGELTVDSAPGQGARFTLSLPAA